MTTRAPYLPSSQRYIGSQRSFGARAKSLKTGSAAAMDRIIRWLRNAL
jgi:hypothetical protein